MGHIHCGIQLGWWYYGNMWAPKRKSHTDGQDGLFFENTPLYLPHSHTNTMLAIPNTWRGKLTADYNQANLINRPDLWKDFSGWRRKTGGLDNIHVLILAVKCILIDAQTWIMTVIYPTALVFTGLTLIPVLLHIQNSCLIKSVLVALTTSGWWLLSVTQMAFRKKKKSLIYLNGVFPYISCTIFGLSLT